MLIKTIDILKKLRTNIYVIITFALVMFGIFIYNFMMTSPAVKASIISFITVLSVALVTHYQTKKREINARHFADKRQGYMEMIELLANIIMSTKKNKKISEDTIVKKMMAFKKSLMVWGGADTIKAWHQYETASNKNPSTNIIMSEMENVLREIRKDLGHDDSSLEFGRLIGLYLDQDAKEKIFS